MAIPAHIAPGVVIGEDYKVVRLLREGGMGAVYVAEQLSTGAQRALKIMHRQLAADARARRRFEQEARASAQIESDHVVQVLGAGVDVETQLPWLAMELLQGQDLADRIGGGTLAVDEVKLLLAQLCDALGAAHRVGIVHRDLKPENVFLAKSRRQNEPFAVKVLDFGIAKLVSESQTSATGALGTPLWMSPEQTSPGEAITAATDVWALGLITFTLLTGVRYWRAANTAEVSLPVLLRELAIEPIDPASTRAVRLGVGERIPEGFDAWFARCVVREREARFADADEAWAALAPILEHWSVGNPLALARGSEVKRSDELAATKMSNELPWVTGKKVDPVPADSPLRAPPTTPPPRGVSRVVVGLVGIVVAGAIGAAYARYEKDRRLTPAATPTVSVAAKPAPSPSPSPSASVSPTALGAAEAANAKMITFAEATFTMGSQFGSDNEQPAHKATVSAYLLDVTEVTTAAYARCVAASACTPARNGAHCNAGVAGRENHPINCVTFDQANAFCAWRGDRLPNERELEYAAEGKEGRTWPWGNVSPVHEPCWDRCATNEGTCAVGSHPKAATPEGVQDLGGNVWEWTSVKYCPYASPSCADDRRAIRGGGWCGKDPTTVRSAIRDGKAPNDHSSEIGFRCARSL
jgi:formylglycine-generating enzyme required for sulfatase activity/tRNA A-37 threonylcarbamoyl transferase component Bud32